MKNHFLGITALFFLSNICFASSGSYLDTDPVARYSGMGSACTSLADDSNAPLFNPAGLTNMGLNQFEASGSIGLLSQDRINNILSASQQLPPNSYLGFNIIQFGVNNIDGRDLNGLQTSNLQDLELAFTSSYALDLDYHFKAGISASFLYQNLAGINARGFGGADIGILFIPSVLYDFSLGATIHHLGGFLFWDSENTEYLNPNLRVGFSQKFLKQTLIFAYDAEWTMQTNFNIVHHAGMEWWIQNFLAIRGGWDIANPTLGLSIRYLNYTLDYAYIFETNNLGDTHRLSFDFAL